jgi:hypothetical protein
LAGQERGFSRTYFNNIRVSALTKQEIEEAHISAGDDVDVTMRGSNLTY